MPLEDARTRAPEPERNSLRTLAASRKIAFQGITAGQAEMLERALAKAHVGLCGYSTVLSVAPAMEADFQVHPDGQFVLSERVFSSPAILELHLRHAIELRLWFQLCSGQLAEAHVIAIALLAALTTTRCYLLMPTAERQQMAARSPKWLLDGAGAAEGGSAEAVLTRLAAHLQTLMPLQGSQLTASVPTREALELAWTYSAVANPTEFTLTQQGDDRLLVDPATGLNKYGCSPRPRPEAITFSSCTASSVSEFAYREAELLRQRLMCTLPAGTLAAQYEAEIEGIRTGLKQLLGLDALETEVILSASGTDAELYPLVLFRSSDKSRLVNIVVAPDEVGSGTVLAAGGRHFSATTPHGAKVKQGDAVADAVAGSVEVVCVPIRRPDGMGLTREELEQRVTDAVAAAAKAADHIILHIVDNTKTGIVAPDADFVAGLREKFGSKLHVLVDACQFRLEKTNLHRYLTHGFCMLVTGSKFFTGPPFAGALLIPPQFSLSGGGLPLPPGFADYFTRSEVPRALQPQAQHLSAALNPGLLFRWIGALKEMKCFYGVASPERTTILKKFRHELLESIRRNLDLRLLESAPPQRWKDADPSLWDAQPTIFSFAVRDPAASGSDQWLRLRELKAIYYLLNRDCAPLLPQTASEPERKLAAQKCHIGQPVILARGAGGEETSGMRIACGARLVYGITGNDALGRTSAERFQRELSDARTVLAKISLILKYWTRFCQEVTS